MGKKRKRDEEQVEEDTTPQEVKLLKKEVGKAAPSSLAHPTEFCNIVGLGHIIGCNRPFEPDTIPIVLLHKAFSDRYRASLSKQALDCVLKLSSVGCKWYIQAA